MNLFFIHKHVFNFFNQTNIITSLQSGFVPNDSTVNQLATMYNTFCHALDEGKEVGADISKAFERVWHRGLLFKLESVGIVGNLLEWFTDYLDGRKQLVTLSGVKSDLLNITAGVPQGSILGPLLFLVYINDIVNNIDATINLFADDTSLYLIVDSPITCSDTLNKDLETIHSCANKWLINFNANKTESVIFSRKLHKPYHPPLFLNNTQIIIHNYMQNPSFRPQFRIEISYHKK